MSNPSTIEAVQGVIRSHGFGSYTGHVPAVLDALPEGQVTAHEIHTVVRNRIGVTAPDRLVDEVARTINAQRQGVAGEARPAAAAVGFDRDNAARVIREHASRADIRADYVEQVLIEAGLVDPDDDDAEDDSEAPSWARHMIATVEGLASWARGQGWRG